METHCKQHKSWHITAMTHKVHSARAPPAKRTLLCYKLRVICKWHTIYNKNIIDQVILLETHLTLQLYASTCDSHVVYITMLLLLLLLLLSCHLPGKKGKATSIYIAAWHKSHQGRCTTATRGKNDAGVAPVGRQPQGPLNGCQHTKHRSCGAL